MIKTTLPTFETSLDEKTKKLVTVEKEIVVTIDTSLFAEQRWEANFPHNAKNETLFPRTQTGAAQSRAVISRWPR